MVDKIHESFGKSISPSVPRHRERFGITWSHSFRLAREVLLVCDDNTVYALKKYVNWLQTICLATISLLGLNWPNKKIHMFNLSGVRFSNFFFFYIDPLTQINLMFGRENWR